jgi:hypothetical protein
VQFPTAFCGKGKLIWIGSIKSPGQPGLEARAFPNSFGAPSSLGWNWFNLLVHKKSAWLSPFNPGPSGETGVWWVACSGIWSHNRGSPKWTRCSNLDSMSTAISARVKAQNTV